MALCHYETSSGNRACKKITHTVKEVNVAYATTVKTKSIYAPKPAAWSWETEQRKANEQRTREIQTAARNFRKNIFK